MGPGALNQLTDEIRQLKGRKALFVTDKGVLAAGLLKPAQKDAEDIYKAAL